MKVNSKRENYLLMAKGVFGNKLRTWYSLDAFLWDWRKGFEGTVTIRYSGKEGGRFCMYNVNDIAGAIISAIVKGADEQLFIINESAPDTRLLIQGELMHNENGYVLFYSTEKGKMRDMLKNGVHAFGLQAKMLLQKYLFPSSYDDVQELLDKFPDSVIEFSAYDTTVGDCIGRNTVIWEVRNY